MTYERVISRPEAIYSHPHGDLHSAIYRRLVLLAECMDELTADNLRSVIPDLLKGVSEHNVMGSVFRDAAKEGILTNTHRVTTSQRDDAKGRAVIIWKSNVNLYPNRCRAWKRPCTA
jgi:hypothetical protein